MPCKSKHSIEKQKRVVFFFPVADKIILKYFIVGPQTAVEVVDEQILTGADAAIPVHDTKDSVLL